MLYMYTLSCVSWSFIFCICRRSLLIWSVSNYGFRSSLLSTSPLVVNYQTIVHEFQRCYQSHKSFFLSYFMIAWTSCSFIVLGVSAQVVLYLHVNFWVCSTAVTTSAVHLPCESPRLVILNKLFSYFIIYSGIPFKIMFFSLSRA